MSATSLQTEEASAVEGHKYTQTHTPILTVVKRHVLCSFFTLRII